MTCLPILTCICRVTPRADARASARDQQALQGKSKQMQQVNSKDAIRDWRQALHAEASAIHRSPEGGGRVAGRMCTKRVRFFDSTSALKF